MLLRPVVILLWAIYMQTERGAQRVMLQRIGCIKLMPSRRCRLSMHFLPLPLVLFQEGRVEAPVGCHGLEKGMVSYVKVRPTTLTHDFTLTG